MSVTEDCTGCGVCAEEKGCPFHAISMDEENERAVINHDRCMGCGACERKCDADALKLGLDPSKGEPLDIEALSRDLKSPTTP